MACEETPRHRGTETQRKRALINTSIARFLCVSVTLCLGVSIYVAAQAPSYDLILRNGRVVDGSGSPWYRGDVAVRGDTIVRIAPSITESAARVIDAGGQVIAPGFIDIHSHARDGIFEVPAAEN